MKYMLDTNICIYIIRKKPLNVLKILQKIDISQVVISSITLSELEYGVQKSSNIEQNRLALLGFIASLGVVSYDNKAALEYGKIRADLERKGQLIGAMDLIIGAHALQLGCILVTNNEKEFRRIGSLKVENWV